MPNHPLEKREEPDARFGLCEGSAIFSHTLPNVDVDQHSAQGPGDCFGGAADESQLPIWQLREDANRKESTSKRTQMVNRALQLACMEAEAKSRLSRRRDIPYFILCPNFHSPPLLLDNAASATRTQDANRLAHEADANRLGTRTASGREPPRD